MNELGKASHLFCLIYLPDVLLRVIPVAIESIKISSLTIDSKELNILRQFFELYFLVKLMIKLILPIITKTDSIIVTYKV